MSTPVFFPDESRDDALARAASLLAEAGIEEPIREARLLICAALGLSLVSIITRGEEPLGDNAPHLATWVQRRMAREPLSRIRGHHEFRGRRFETSPAVLDPRPETELLIDAALERWREVSLTAPRILDLGTGSGAIIVSLLAELPDAQGVAVDIAAEALDVAARNAETHDVLERLFLLEGDLFAPVSGSFDLIISNPPYIPSRDLASLEPEVQNFDPALALDGGEDGVVFYRRIISGASDYLASGGFLALELGINQAQAVQALAEAAGFADLRLHPDLSGIERHLTMRWTKS